LYRHEPDAAIYCSGLPYFPAPTEHYIDLARDYLALLTAGQQVKSSGSTPFFPKSYRSEGAERLRQKLILSIKGVLSFRPLSPLDKKIRIPDFIDRQEKGSPRVLIKSVDSLGRTLTFSSAFPDMKVVHVVRHPCAYVASLLRGQRLNLMTINTFLKTQHLLLAEKGVECDLERLKALSLEQQLASLWMLQNEKVMREMKDRDNYFFLNYDNFSLDAEAEASRLFEFVEICMGEQTVSFIRGKIKHNTTKSDYYQLARSSENEATKWRKELSSEQIDAVHGIVKDSLPGQLFNF
jgi:hypothetical protein